MGQLLLVVDNSRTVCRAVQLVFHASVYDVVSAPTASDALQLARSRRPTAVIIAYHLPDASGFDLARSFRADAELSALPILMLTGRYHAYDPSEVSRCGANGSIAKPFKTDDLLSALAETLSRPSARAPQYTPDIATVSAPHATVNETSPLPIEIAPTLDEQSAEDSDRAPSIPMPEPSTDLDLEDIVEPDHPALQQLTRPATAAREPAAPPVIPRTTSEPHALSPAASEAPTETAAFRRLKPAGPPPPPNVPRRTLALPPHAEANATPQEQARGFDAGTHAPAQRAERGDFRDETEQVPAVAAQLGSATQPPTLAPTLAVTDAAPTTPPSAATVAAPPPSHADSAERIDPAQLRVIVREAVAPLVREALPAIVKEFLSSMLRQTGQKLDEYSRQRIDAFVANDLPRLADEAIANSLQDVPQMAREAIDRQLYELTGGDA